MTLELIRRGGSANAEQAEDEFQAWTFEDVDAGRISYEEFLDYHNSNVGDPRYEEALRQEAEVFSQHWRERSERNPEHEGAVQDILTYLTTDWSDKNRNKYDRENWELYREEAVLGALLTLFGMGVAGKTADKVDDGMDLMRQVEYVDDDVADIFGFSQGFWDYVKWILRRSRQ